MRVIKNDHIDCFDIDDTLILWKSAPQENSKTEMFGEIEATIHKSHIDEIKRSKMVGRLVVVWSKGGYKYAERVVKQLGLTSYVDVVMSKPSRYFDDLDANDWMYRSYRKDGDKFSESIVDKLREARIRKNGI